MSEESLYMACEEGDFALAQECLEKGANPAGDEDDSPMEAACLGGYVSLVELLVKYGIKPNEATGESGFPPLYFAAWEGHYDTAKKLIELGADVNFERPADGQTALYRAAWSGHRRVIELLLNSGADVNKQKTDGQTALFVACWEGHLEIVDFLLQKGADPNLCAKTTSPLLIACLEGFLEIVRLLVTHGAQVNSAPDGDTPLYKCAYLGHEEIVHFLVRSGADVNAVSSFGQTALHAALIFGRDTEIASFLLNHGANPDARDELGQSVIYLAVIFGHTELWSLLSSHRSNLSDLKKKNDQKAEKMNTFSYVEHQSHEPVELMPDLEVLERNNIHLKKWIGRGSFGDVWKGEMNGEVVAVKFLYKANQNDIKEMLEETSLLG